MIYYDALGSVIYEISSNFPRAFLLRKVCHWSLTYIALISVQDEARYRIFFPQDHCVNSSGYNSVGLFSVLSSTVLINVSVSMAVPGYVSYYPSVLHFEIRYCDSSDIVFFFSPCLALL